MTDPTLDEMLEIATQREATNEAIIAKVSEEDYQKVQKEVANKKAWEAVEKLYDENGDALQQLADIERLELAKEGIIKYNEALKKLQEND